MTSILKNVYIDKFEDIDNTYKNTYHKTIQMKPLAVNPSMYVDFNEENNSENRNLMLEIMLEYQNIKTLLQKAMFRIRVPKFLQLNKLKILFLGHMLLVMLTEKSLFEHFTKKNYKKQSKKSLEFKK